MPGIQPVEVVHLILALDIGNTNIKAALFEIDGEAPVATFRVATDLRKTRDEFGVSFLTLMHHLGYQLESVKGIILSSVVPAINFTIEHMCEDYFHLYPMTVVPGIKTGIHVKYDNPRDLGSDRLANAVAAYEIYGGPCIVIDFGTATTFGAISRKGEFLGGAICPGIKTATDALVEHTSKLPKIELIKPQTVIGRGTVSGMQAGVVYGYVGQVEYITGKMLAEIGEQDTRVIATGGLSKLIASASGCIGHIDTELTLKGIKRIYDKNK